MPKGTSRFEKHFRRFQSGSEIGNFRCASRPEVESKTRSPGRQVMVSECERSTNVIDLGSHWMPPYPVRSARADQPAQFGSRQNSKVSCPHCVAAFQGAQLEIPSETGGSGHLFQRLARASPGTLMASISSVASMRGRGSGSR